MSRGVCEFCGKSTDVSCYGMQPAPQLCERCYEKIIEMSDEELKKKTMKHYDRIVRAEYILIDVDRWMYKYHFAGCWNIQYAERYKDKIYMIQLEPGNSVDVGPDCENNSRKIVTRTASDKQIEQLKEDELLCLWNGSTHYHNKIIFVDSKGNYLRGSAWTIGFGEGCKYKILKVGKYNTYFLQEVRE